MLKHSSFELQWLSQYIKYATGQLVTIHWFRFRKYEMKKYNKYNVIIRLNSAVSFTVSSYHSCKLRQVYNVFTIIY